MNSDPLVQEYFVKQRRNIILISLVILLSEYLGFKIEKINILGNQIDVENPQNFCQLLWVVWVYFLWRFYSYLNSLGDLGFAYSFRNTMSLLLHEAAKEKAQNDPSKFLISTSGHNCKVGSHLFGIKYLDKFSAKVGIEILGEPPYVSIRENIGVPLGFNVLFIAYCKFFFGIIFKSHLSSEYILPFFIASSPVFYAISQIVFNFFSSSSIP